MKITKAANTQRHPDGSPITIQNPLMVGGRMALDFASRFFFLSTPGGVPLGDKYNPLVITAQNLEAAGLNLNTFQDAPPAVDVRGVNSLLLDAREFGWFTWAMEVSWDYEYSWHPLELWNIHTGNGHYRVDVAGVYAAHTNGATHVRWRKLSDGNGGRLILAKGTQAIIPRPKSVLDGLTRYAPRNPALAPTRQALPGGLIVRDYHVPTKTLWGYAAQTLKTSANYGATWQDVKTWAGAGYIRTVKRLQSGTLIVVRYDQAAGQDVVERSTDGGATWSERNRYATEGNIGQGWGVSAVGARMSYAVYVNKPVPGVGHVWRSIDDGLTWSSIFTSFHPDDGTGLHGEGFRNWHYHDVTEDPYRNGVWVCNGDGYGIANVRFIDHLANGDLRVAPLWPESAGKTQPTTVQPMPLQVLLESDQFPFSGALRLWYGGTHTPHQGGAVPLAVETAYVNSAPGTWLNGTQRGNQYWEVGAVYTAYGTGETGMTRLVGTRDGITFYEMYHALGNVTCWTVLGGESGGKLMMVCSNHDSTDPHLLIADSPEWLPL